MGDIAGLRQKVNETQAEFGRRLGVSAACISHYEIGRRHPQWEIAKRIAKLAARESYPMTWDDVMGGPLI